MAYSPFNFPVVKPFRPLMGLAQGSIARIAEEIRQGVHDDSAYTEEHYYGLSLRTKKTLSGPAAGVGGLLGQATFIFPLGPQSVKTSRMFRQNVTPTLGGLVTEERGILWHDIIVEGNFGLEPKMAVDSSLFPEDMHPVVPWMTPLSGPKWTQKMFANFIDRYALLKTYPEYAAATQLVWHDYKNDDHFIVVPVKADLNRTINDRFMYPFSLTFRAIARTTPALVPPKPITLATILAAIQSGIRVARMGVSVLTDAANTVTAAMGMVKYYAATIDSVLDEINRAKAACDTMVKTGSSLGTDLGGMFARSASEMTDAVLQTADTTDGFPEDVRQALYGATDMFDQIGACSEFDATSTQAGRVIESTENQTTSVTSPSSPSATGAIAVPASTAAKTATARSFRDWKGWSPYVIKSGDTLVNIAMDLLGDPSLWYEIALRNSLKAPYITSSGLPGTVHVGDTIMIPNTTAMKKTTSASSAEDISPEALYGRDIKMFETTGSRPGRTQVDIRIDPSGGQDIATIAGVDNLVQACQMRLWTEQGQHLLDPSYGTPSSVGYPNNSTTVQALKNAIKAGLLGDSRIERITNMIVVSEDDMVDVNITANPVGSTSSVEVSVTAL